MVTAARTATMTALEYLAWEREQAERHEFVDGVIYAMAGGSPRHNALEANLSAALKQALRGRDCAPLSSNQKIGVREGARYYYADASVVCGAVGTETNAHDVVTNPSVLIELLSASTEAFDRGRKWGDYQRLASLQDYLLVSQRVVQIENYRRSDRSWLYTSCGLGERITLADGAVLDVDAVYDGAMRFPSDE